jgi:hypothetical protein
MEGRVHLEEADRIRILPAPAQHRLVRAPHLPREAGVEAVAGLQQRGGLHRQAEAVRRLAFLGGGEAGGEVPALRRVARDHAEAEQPRQRARHDAARLAEGAHQVGFAHRVRQPAIGAASRDRGGQRLGRVGRALGGQVAAEIGDHHRPALPRGDARRFQQAQRGRTGVRDTASRAASAASATRVPGGVPSASQSERAARARSWWRCGAGTGIVGLVVSPVLVFRANGEPGEDVQAMRLRTSIAALVVLCSLSLPVAAQDVLRVRLNADIRSTEPGVNRDANTDGIHWHLVEGLVALRGDATVAPMLAERIDVSEDGRTYTFTLRQGVRFHNGQPLTSADVAFAMQRYLRRETNWRCRPDLDSAVTRLTAVETPDERTVVMRLEQPSALFLTVLARPDCGQTGIWHRDSLNADGSWRAPVGTGPFRLGEWRRGQYVELTRFEAYAALPGEPDGLAGNKTAMVERVRLSVIPDDAAARAALLAGNIDILPDARTRDLPDLRQRGFTSTPPPRWTCRPC